MPELTEIQSKRHQVRDLIKPVRNRVPRGHEVNYALSRTLDAVRGVTGLTQEQQAGRLEVTRAQLSRTVETVENTDFTEVLREQAERRADRNSVERAQAEVAEAARRMAEAQDRLARAVAEREAAATRDFASEAASLKEEILDAVDDAQDVLTVAREVAAGRDFEAYQERKREQRETRYDVYTDAVPEDYDDDDEQAAWDAFVAGDVFNDERGDAVPEDTGPPKPKFWGFFFRG